MIQYPLLALGVAISMSLTVLSGCTKEGEASSISQAEESGQVIIDESHQEEPAEPEPVYSERTERYYDYFEQNSHISLLIPWETGREGFSEAQMAGFAICELIRLDRYDYETGHPREEFDEITEKYFGTRIENFETGMSTVIPETGNITSTGWGWGGVYAVLKEFEESDDGVCTAVFYTAGVGMGDDRPLKQELLKGELEHCAMRSLTEVVFRERMDGKGDLYFQFISIRHLGEPSAPYVPYHGD